VTRLKQSQGCCSTATPLENYLINLISSSSIIVNQISEALESRAATAVTTIRQKSHRIRWFPMPDGASCICYVI
jgi:hypothetical protein